MLRALAIRDIVLIERLELDFGPGLNVLTGETGAGKSILLDALGFALGRKVRRDLVRAGAEQGSVTAEFWLAADHPVRGHLAELDLPDGGDELILRRVAAQNGPSRGFVNDQRVSGEVLARIGAGLVEVHGQQDDRGLLNPRVHRALLDSYAGLDDRLGDLRAAWSAWQAAERAVDDARGALAQAAEDADFLRHSLQELEQLAPEAGEDDALDAERRLIRQAAGLTEEIARAAQALSLDGAEGMLGDALSRLTHAAGRAEGRLEAPIAAIDRTMAELTEAQQGLADVLEALTFDPGRLEVVEERLFAIRGLARKHNVAPDDLPGLARDMADRLQAIDRGEDHIAALQAAAGAARNAYDAAATAVSERRRQAGAALDKAVTRELAPLRMEAARFITEIAPSAPGPEGSDQVRFTAAINPGTPPGPIDRIASGGELSRFLLALKVQLAQRAGDMSLIFDEVDRGVGGATADAVGRRLARLAAQGQVLVVTHAPQVAAAADRHFRIRKSAETGIARTDVAELDAAERETEIARMLAGDRITDEARAAARALIAGTLAAQG